MEGIEKEFTRLRSKSNLGKSISDVSAVLSLLQAARDRIAADPDGAAETLAELQRTVGSALERVNDSQKEVYSGLNRYGRALDKTFKAASTYSTTDYDALSSQSPLIKRAIAMHLIRSGQFLTSTLFLHEAGPIDIPPALQPSFTSLYTILTSMRAHNLAPATTWARLHSSHLSARGSTLEFDLCRLEYTHRFLRDRDDALRYARREFTRFEGKHLRDVQRLVTAVLYKDGEGPYVRLFADEEKMWSDVAHGFTREFCSLLGLSAESPLYVAATAGAIALPTLVKMAAIMREKKTEWSTVNELPAEIALPPGYQFHSIFVCPVSKDQTTESNPPMMLPCGHVIAQESLQRLAKGGSTVTLKCPYCPRESSLTQAKRVVI